MKVCARLFSALFLFLMFSSIVFAQGTVVTDYVYSPSLDREHPVNIYLPAGYDPDDTLTRYPVIYYMHSGWGNHQSENEAITALNNIVGSEIRPVILVKPSTYYGPYHGMTWYTNSILNGNYEDFIVEDLVTYIDSTYNTIAERSKRSIDGFSMGGYGALKLAVKHPDLFASVATHGGILYIEQYLDLLIPLVLEESGGSGPFSPSTGTWGDLIFSNAAAFSPNLENEPYYLDLPIDDNGDVIDLVYVAWAMQDPWNLLEDMPGDFDLDFHLDAGTADYWYPLTTSMASRLEELDIEYTRKSFDGAHLVPVSRFIESFTFHDSVMWAETPHPERTSVNPMAVEPGEEFLIQTEILNTEGITYSVSAMVCNLEGEAGQDIPLYDDGLHGDGEAADNIWGGTAVCNTEDFWKVAIFINTSESEAEIPYGNEARFTTFADVSMDRVEILPEGSVPLPGETHFFRFSVHNGEERSFQDVSIRMTYNGDYATFTAPEVQIGNIDPGESRLTQMPMNVFFTEQCPQNTVLDLDLVIQTGGVAYWPDTLRVEIGPDLMVGIEANLPMDYSIDSIYPNPFNAKTRIDFSIPSTTDLNMSVYNVLGKKVDVLHAGKITRGVYSFEWDAGNYSSGTYVLNVKSSSGWNKSRKLFLVK